MQGQEEQSKKKVVITIVVLLVQCSTILTPTALREQLFSRETMTTNVLLVKVVGDS